MTTHPTADEVYQMVRARLPYISLGTVYRNLDMLAEAGEILLLEALAGKNVLMVARNRTIMYVVRNAEGWAMCSPTWRWIFRKSWRSLQELPLQASGLSSRAFAISAKTECGFKQHPKKKEAPMKSLKGTQTEKNLLLTFAGESQARNRYAFAASAAKKEGFEQISAIFAETAEQEKEHGKRMFKFLEGGDLEITGTFRPDAPKTPCII